MAHTDIACIRVLLGPNDEKTWHDRTIRPSEETLPLSITRQGNVRFGTSWDRSAGGYGGWSPGFAKIHVGEEETDGSTYVKGIRYRVDPEWWQKVRQIEFKI